MSERVAVPDSSEPANVIAELVAAISTMPVAELRVVSALWSTEDIGALLRMTDEAGGSSALMRKNAVTRKRTLL